jgi:hypothetical protein
MGMLSWMLFVISTIATFAILISLNPDRDKNLLLPTIWYFVALLAGIGSGLCLRNATVEFRIDGYGVYVLSSQAIARLARLQIIALLGFATLTFAYLLTGWNEYLVAREREEQAYRLHRWLTGRYPLLRDWAKKHFPETEDEQKDD